MRIFIDDNTRSKRRNWVWSDQNLKRAKDVLEVVNGLKPYWPLTLRQVFYPLLHKAQNQQHRKHWLCKNRTIDIYDALKTLLKQMRINERLPYEAIHDEHRILSYRQNYENAEQFVEDEVEYLFRGYNRCLAQGQPRHLEIWLEKQTLLHIFEPIARKYCRRLIVCKGYNSYTFVSDFFFRAVEALNLGQIPTILYFGDWDPDGLQMPYAAAQTLEDDLGLPGIEHHRIGINPEHFGRIQAYPVPIKKKTSRLKWFKKKCLEFGIPPTCYELDALHPAQLQSLVENTVKKYTDLDIFSDQQDRGRQELSKINKIRTDTKRLIKQRVTKF